MKKSRSIAAIVLAAGRGTRMASSRAKVVHELAGEPLIAYPLRALGELGVGPIVVVVGFDEERVRSACGPFDCHFVVQKEQRGTGHAAAQAKKVLGGFRGDILLVNGDLPFVHKNSYKRLISAHVKSRADFSLLTSRIENPAEFGRIVRDNQRQVCRILEYADATDQERENREVNVGLYCADAEFLFSGLSRLRASNAQSELYLTDLLEIARRQNRTIASASAPGIETQQVSDRADLARCEAIQRERINTYWMKRGVTFVDPSTAYIGARVRLGRDVIIGPNVTLYGATQVAAGSCLEGTATVRDSRIGKSVHVKFGVVMNQAVLGDRVQIGPFAQLRPGTQLGNDVHIGDFVETKNAVLGRGTKANHLAYLGDADIGEETNIGAGTITCNYDGFRKHRTTIGDRVQIGSDSQLVAPVTIADDAYVSTGTTVRKDVEKGALVLNPKPQMSRKGWVALRRKKESKRAGKKVTKGRRR